MNDANQITSMVGNTPLVDLTGITNDLAPGVRVLAKAEYFNRRSTSIRVAQ
jgi:cysteine synthase